MVDLAALQCQLAALMDANDGPAFDGGERLGATLTYSSNRKPRGENALMTDSVVLRQ